MMLERRVAALETKASSNPNTLEKRIDNLEQKASKVNRLESRLSALERNTRRSTKPRPVSVNEYKENRVRRRTVPSNKKHYGEPAIFWYEYTLDKVIDVGAKQAVQGYLLAGTSEIFGRDQKTAHLKRFAKELGVAVVNVYAFTRHGTHYHNASFMYKDNDGVPEYEREQVMREMRKYMRENLDEFVPGLK